MTTLSQTSATPLPFSAGFSRLFRGLASAFRWAGSRGKPLPAARAPRGPSLPVSRTVPKTNAATALLKRNPKQMGPSLLADHSPAAAIHAVLRECVIADLETTGLSATEDDIIEVGAWRLSAQGEVLAKLTLLVKPRFAVPSNISKLTGITDQLVRVNGVELHEALSQLYTFAGETPVLFHNAGFDARFLVAAVDRTGQQLPVLHTRDTLNLSRKLWPELGSHRLGVVSAHLNGPTPGHRVSSDLAAMQVLVQRAAERLLAARAERLRRES